MEHRMLVLPNDQKLITQLNSLHYRFTNAGEPIFESTSNHDDHVWALALAVHAARKTFAHPHRLIIRSVDPRNRTVRYPLR